MAGYRILDVTVVPHGSSKWKWQVCDSGDVLMSGFERSRISAKHEGDSAMFLLLAAGWFPKDQPHLP